MQKGKRDDKDEDKEKVQENGTGERRLSLKRKPSKAGFTQGGKGKPESGKETGIYVRRY